MIVTASAKVEFKVKEEAKVESSQLLTGFIFLSSFLLF